MSSLPTSLPSRGAPRPRGRGVGRRRPALVALASGVALALGVAPALASASPAQVGLGQLRVISSNEAGTTGDSNSTGLILSSRDAQWVVFGSYAHNLVTAPVPADSLQLYAKNRISGAVVLVSSDATGTTPLGTDSEVYTITHDSTSVLFRLTTDLAGHPSGQLYLKNFVTGALTLVTSTATGTPADLGGQAVRSDQTISQDGRYVTFTSMSTNLGSGQPPATQEIYRKDLQTGAVDIASRTPSGATSARGSFDFPVISPDGQEVAFQAAGDMLPADAHKQLVVRHMDTGTTQVVSALANGAHATTGRETTQVVPQFSSDSRRVLFLWNYNGLSTVPGSPLLLYELYLKDLTTSALRVVSSSRGGVPANSGTIGGFSWASDENRVAYASDATNFAGDNQGVATGAGQIYVKHLDTGLQYLASSLPSGAPMRRAGTEAVSSSPRFSPDGRRIFFVSNADNADPSGGPSDRYQSYLWVKQPGNGALTLVSATGDGTIFTTGQPGPFTTSTKVLMYGPGGQIYQKSL